MERVPSPVMSRTDAREYLGMDEKQLKRQIILKTLRVDPDTGLFARKQVEDLAKAIEWRIINETDGTAMGQLEPKVGMLGGVRQEPSMVPKQN